MVDLLEVLAVMDLDPEAEEDEHNLQVDLVDLVVEEHSKADQVQQVAEEDIMVVLVEIPSLHAVLMVQEAEDQDILVV